MKAGGLLFKAENIQEQNMALGFQFLFKSVCVAMGTWGFVRLIEMLPKIIEALNRA